MCDGCCCMLLLMERKHILCNNCLISKRSLFAFFKLMFARQILRVETEANANINSTAERHSDALPSTCLLTASLAKIHVSAITRSSLLSKLYRNSAHIRTTRPAFCNLLDFTNMWHSGIHEALLYAYARLCP
jgi:hypothetical protein